MAVLTSILNFFFSSTRVITSSGTKTSMSAKHKVERTGRTNFDNGSQNYIE